MSAEVAMSAEVGEASQMDKIGTVGVGTVGVSRSEGEAVLEAPLRVRNEWARAKDTEGVVCQTHIGGQALVEGIMMRGKYNWAVAVREPSGSIYLEEHDLASGKPENSWQRKPVIRGCTALVESLALGFKAIEIASQHAFDFDEDEEIEGAGEGAGESEGAGEGAGESESGSESGSAGEGGSAGEAKSAQGEIAEVNPANDDGKSAEANATEATACPEESTPVAAAAAAEAGAAVEAEATEDDRTASANAIPKPVMTISMIVGLLLGVGLFVVLPAFITNLLVGDYGEKTLLWNLVDGVLRIAVFIFYIWLIGRMKDIKRMFGYHGAEHKAIHCYEHGLDLTVDHAQSFPTLHVRCGTAFMLTTMIIAILVFTVVPVGPLIDALGVTNGALRLILVILSRIILLPVVAGLSYEVTVKWAGARPENPLVQIVLWPGMQMQRLTTNQPDDGMIECAIEAMRLVLARESLEHAKQGLQANQANQAKDSV